MGQWLKLFAGSGQSISHEKNILVFEGDSMTAGSNFAANVLSLLGGSGIYDSENIATSGETVADMITQFPTQAEPLSRPTAIRNVLILRAGTNDLYFDATAEETIDNITDYCALARAAGFKIVIGTILPRSGFSQPAELPARRLEVNDWLRLNWRTIADGFADVSADPRIGDPGDEDNTTYYSDQVHMTDAGTLIAAQYFADAVERMYSVQYATPLFIFNGESNSGGIALNSDANVTELGVHRKIKIYNNAVDYFQYLQLGVNNLRDHDGLSSYYDNSHGLELGLTNCIEAGRIDSELAYILKTGQGGSTISQWGTGGAYYLEFLARSEATQDFLANESIVPIIFFSLGLNDIIAGTNVTTWGSAIVTHLANLRSVWGATTPIYMTNFTVPPLTTGADAYNYKINEIVAADPYTYLLDTTGTSNRDNYHWNYNGFLEMAETLIDEHFGTSGTLTSPVITPAGGAYLEEQEVTMTAEDGAQIRYTTDGTTPSSHSTLYTGPITVSSTSTIKAIAMKKAYKNSSVNSETYSIDASDLPDIDDLHTWFDSSFGQYQERASQTTASGDGDPIGSWVARTGQIAVAPADGQRPLRIEAEQAGLPVARFDGSNDYLSISSGSYSLSQPFTCFIVAKKSSANTVAGVFVDSDSNTQAVMYVGDTGTMELKTGFGSGSALTISGADMSEWGAITIVANGASTKLRLDGQNEQTGNTGTNGLAGIRIGDIRANVVAGYTLQGDIGEILIYSRALDAGEIEQVEAYLRSRWGTPAPTTPLVFGDLSLAIMDGDAIRCNTGSGGGFSPGAGGVATTTIDPTVPFELTWYSPDAASVNAVVVGLMNSHNTTYNWSNTTFLGCYYNYVNDVYVVDSTGANIDGPDASVLPKYYKIKNSGNDLLYQHSADGVTYTTTYTQTGILSGETELWVKVLFAVDGTSKNVTVNLTGG